MTTIPDTLDEALDLIIHSSRKEDLAAFAATPEGDYATMLHFGAGMAMRNNWGLWHNETGIAKWFRDNGIFHGDDRSGTIYRALWCRLNNAPFDIKAEAAHYEAFWAKRDSGFHQAYYVTKGKDGRISISLDTTPQAG